MYCRPLPPVPKKNPEEEVYEEMEDFSSNPRYSAAPSLLTKCKDTKEANDIERGLPDGGEGRIKQIYYVRTNSSVHL